MRALAGFLLVVTLIELALFSGIEHTQATLSSNWSDTMLRQQISTTSQHIISFTLASGTSFAASETMIFTWGSGFTFPAGAGSWTTADFSFNDGTARTITAVGAAPTCTSGVNNVSVTIDGTNRRLTVTACPTYTTSSTNATITFTVQDTTTNRQITNPSSAGSYGLTIAGTYGDDAITIAVPIVDSDQVGVTASVGGYITFDLDIGDGSHGETATPYTIALGTLLFSAATTDATSGISEIFIDLDSNGDHGTVVQVKSANAALSSASTSDTIPSTTAGSGMTLNSTNGNYGLAVKEFASATEGALTPVSPFNVFATGAAVGGLTTSFQTLYNTGGNPIIGGNGQMAVRAVAGKSTSAATDYTDTLTFRATATY